MENIKVREKISQKIHSDENNVTTYEYPSNKVITIVTNFSKVVLEYAYRRARIQQKWSRILGVKGNKRLKIALRKLRVGREMLKETLSRSS